MKRFYKKATVAKEGDRFRLFLDGKGVLTPAKNPLTVPQKQLAEAMAAEWMAQRDKIDPLSMPLNRLANTAIDRTSIRFDEVVSEILNFGLHDLLCYRAPEPEDLKKTQAKTWDPFLDWFHKAHQIHLKTTSELKSIDQDPIAILALKELLHSFSPFVLTGIHNATTLTGSVVLGLAVRDKAEPLKQIWKAANIDEDYQMEKWGIDEEVRKIRKEKENLFLAVGTFLSLVS